MKKTLIVLCGTALLLVGLCLFGFVTTTTAQPAGELRTMPWQNARAMEVKMLIAKERDCVDAIKRMRGIANASVVVHKRPVWERNVWARGQVTSASVVVEAIDNRPLCADTIGAIGQIVSPLFGITDMEEICITDRKHSRTYNGAGEEMTADGSRQRAEIVSPVDPDYIELLKKRVETAQKKLAWVDTMDKAGISPHANMADVEKARSDRALMRIEFDLELAEAEFALLQAQRKQKASQ